MEIEKIIYDFGNKNNLQIGICSAQGFENIREMLEEENHKLNGFVEQDIEKRIYPNITMEDVKSIIVVCMGYKKKYGFEYDGKLRGRISMGAVGNDYHNILNKNMEQLVDEMKKDIDFKYKIFSDTGPIVDREVAVRAGLGYYGKNGLVHCLNFGSVMFIGYIFTNIKLNESEVIEFELCGDCNICIESCPTGALSKDNKFYAEKCISFLTQTKEVLSKKQMKDIGIQLYGCDICQNVCPRNRLLYAEVITDIDKVMPLLEDILKISNKEFKQRFGSTAAGWRGKKIIQRNALVALSNIKSQQSIELLEKFVEDDRELISETARIGIEVLTQRKDNTVK